MTDERITIYALTESDDTTPRYIGQTRLPDQRLAQHVSAPPNAAVKAWLSDMAKRGKVPHMRVLALVEPALANATEAAMMSLYGADGRLLNAHRAGAGRPRLPARERADRRLTIRLRREDEARLDALRDVLAHELGEETYQASETEVVCAALELLAKRHGIP